MLFYVKRHKNTNAPPTRLSPAKPTPPRSPSTLAPLSPIHSSSTTSSSKNGKEWTCPACSFSNEKYQYICEMCGTKRNKSQAPSGQNDRESTPPTRSPSTLAPRSPINSKTKTDSRVLRGSPPKNWLEKYSADRDSVKQGEG